MIEIIREINDLGLVINNLFQRDNMMWQCNVRSINSNTKGLYFSDFVRHMDIEECLFLALEKIKTDFKPEQYQGVPQSDAGKNYLDRLFNDE